jgi:hypothetical protein
VELVAEAAEDRFLVPLPLVRSGASIDPSVVVAGMQIVTALVTFAQIPETVDYLASKLADWTRRAPRDGLTLVVHGPQGEARLELDEDVQPKDIAALLRLLGRDR